MDYTPGESLNTVNQKMILMGFEGAIKEFAQNSHLLMKNRPQSELELAAIEFYANYLDKQALFGDKFSDMASKLGLNSIQVGDSTFKPGDNPHAKALKAEATLLRKILADLKILHGVS